MPIFFNIENHGKTFMISGGIIFSSNNELFTRKGNNVIPLVFTNRLTLHITYYNI